MADNRAAAYQRRLSGLFAQSATSLIVLRAGLSHSIACFVQPLDNQTISLYFDGNEAVGLVHPGLMLWVQASEDLQVDDLFYYPLDLRSYAPIYTVRKQHVFLQGTTPLVLLAVCD
jgi:hypothetical protein